MSETERDESFARLLHAGQGTSQAHVPDLLTRGAARAGEVRLGATQLVAEVGPAW